MIPPEEIVANMVAVKLQEVMNERDMTRAAARTLIGRIGIAEICECGARVFHVRHYNGSWGLYREDAVEHVCEESWITKCLQRK